VAGPSEPLPYLALTCIGASPVAGTTSGIPVNPGASDTRIIEMAFTFIAPNVSCGGAMRG
jgi:hypothetical protein